MVFGGWKLDRKELWPTVQRPFSRHKASSYTALPRVRADRNTGCVESSLWINPINRGSKVYKP